MYMRPHTFIASLLLTSAAAAGAAEDASAPSIEEVIVTSRKREESLQEVPKSISVMSGEDIGQRGASDYFALTEALPNVSVETWGTGSQSGSIGMRGIVSPELNAGIESAVGTYVDGVLQEGFSGANFDAADVLRVEVLRGPQGTLFGRNSSAGALNVTTRDPTNVFEGQVKVRGGNLDSRGADAFISGPLVEDKLLFKLSGFANRRDGYYHNVVNGRDEQDDNRRGARGALLWKASDQLELTLRADYARVEVDAMSGVNAFQNTVPGFAAVGTFDATHDDPNRVEQENRGVSLTANLDLSSGHRITSISSYRESTLTSLNDLDGTAVPTGVALTPRTSGPLTGFPASVSPFVTAGPLGAGITSLNARSIDSWSQELRLTSPNGPFEYVLGLYYFGRELEFMNAASVDPHMITPFAATTPTGFVGVSVASGIENESTAAFGHADWHMSDRWTLGFGARYTQEEADFTLFDDSYLPPLGLTGVARSVAQDRSEDAVSGDASLTFHASDDVSLYASAARGFKAGGFNTSAGTATRGDASFDNETVNTFELGMKTELFDHRMRLNAAVFLSKFDDIQVETFDPALIAFVIRNAASATIQGFEVETLIEPTRGLSLSAAVGYADAEFDEFDNCTRSGQSCAGMSLLNAPQWTLSASAQYAHPFSAGSIVGRLDWSYRSEFYRAFNFGPTRDFRDRIEGRDLLNARIAYVIPSEKLEFALWGRNLLDERYISQKVFRFDLQVLHGLPRTYGAEMTFRF